MVYAEIDGLEFAVSNQHQFVQHETTNCSPQLFGLTSANSFQKFITSLFIYLGFYVAFNTVQVISRWVVGRAEETSTYSSSGFCTVNCQPTASNYQLSHLRPCWEPNPGLRHGRRECYHSATVAPFHNQ